jgi:hypothetical protein
MIKRGTGLALVFAGMAWTNGASACLCMGIDHAGFVHVAAKRLPSNAIGALFLPPAGSFEYLGRASDNRYIYTGEMEKLSPSSFRITSSEAAASVPATLSYPDLPRGATDTARYFKFVRKQDEGRANKLNSADIARLLKSGVLVDITKATHKAMRLVRVGPVGGFKPGVRYQISYVGKVGRWRFPARVEHAIDSTPLATTEFKYGLAIDGPPVARLLPLTTTSGSCSSNQAALVQNFHYVLPAGHAAYPDAIIFSSESRPVAADAAKFARTVYFPSLCPSEPYASTAFAGGKDIVHAECKSRPGPVTVRGWTGMLEVEDRLHPTSTIRVDLGQAAGGPCTGFGMLKSALDSGDAARIKETACSLDREEGFANAPFPQSLAGFSTDALLAQFSAKDVQLQKCARKAAIRLFNETQLLGGAALARYAAGIADDLRSSDARRVAMAAEGLVELQRNIRRTRAGPPVGGSADALLAAVLDAVVDALIANRAPETEEMVTLLAQVKTLAMRHVPALLKVAASDATGAGNAMLALEQLIPDDPRLHRLMVANARRPLLREKAALAYSRVAGKAQPDVAIAMLTDAARFGSWHVIDALTPYGRRARSATPVLVQLMRAPQHEDLRGAVLDALISVSDGDPLALRTVGDALNAAPGDGLSDYSFAGLATIGEDGRALLPAFEARMRKPLSPQLKTILVQSIATMRLPAAQRDDLLARLNKAPLAPEKD